MNLRMALACGLLLSSDWALAQNQAQRNMQQQQWQLEQTRRGYQAQQDAYAAQQQQAAPPPPPAGQWVKTWGADCGGKEQSLVDSGSGRCYWSAHKGRSRIQSARRMPSLWRQ